MLVLKDLAELEIMHYPGKTVSHQDNLTETIFLGIFQIQSYFKKMAAKSGFR